MPRQKIDLFLGWGNFSDEAITEYVNRITSVEIITIKEKKEYRSKKELSAFFKDRRKGLFKNEIRIIIK